MERDQLASLADAASAIAHPVRASIVTELGDRPSDSASFTALRDAAGLRDNGRFNYHLDQLRGHLVERDGDRYGLTSTGRELATLLRTGHLVAPDRERELSTDSSCHCCGGTLLLGCRPQQLRLRCTDCTWAEEWEIRSPATVFEATPEVARTVVDRTLRDVGRSLADGCCPTCLRSVQCTLTATDDGDRSVGFAVAADCPLCGPVTVAPGLLALVHGATAGFFHDHGVSTEDRPVWGVEFAVTDHETRIRNRDPWRVEIRPQVGTDELVLLVDEGATVSAVKRHTKFAARDVWYPNRGRS